MKYRYKLQSQTAVLDLQQTQRGIQYQIENERNLKSQVSRGLRDGAGEPDLTHAQNHNSKREYARPKSRAAQRQPTGDIPYFGVVILELVLAKVNMLDHGDCCVRRAPVSNKVQEISDSSVEPVSTDDGKREDPNISKLSKTVRHCR